MEDIMLKKSNRTDPSQRIVVTLPRAMYEDIKALAEFNRRPMSEEVRIAIESRMAQARAARVGASQ
jgi:hypothetical protein